MKETFETQQKILAETVQQNMTQLKSDMRRYVLKMDNKFSEMQSQMQHVTDYQGKLADKVPEMLKQANVAIAEEVRQLSQTNADLLEKITRLEKDKTVLEEKINNEEGLSRTLVSLLLKKDLKKYSYLFCDKGWDLLDDKCYLLSSDAYTWDNAKDFCLSNDAEMPDRFKVVNFFRSSPVLSFNSSIWIDAKEDYHYYYYYTYDVKSKDEEMEPNCTVLNPLSFTVSYSDCSTENHVLCRKNLLHPV